MGKTIYKVADRLFQMLDRKMRGNVSVGIGANNVLNVYIFKPARIPDNFLTEYFGYKVEVSNIYPPLFAA